MTSHVEDFVWGAFNNSLSNFGSASSHDNVDATEEWARQLGGGGGGGEDKAETHISFQDLYASIVSNDGRCAHLMLTQLPTSKPIVLLSPRFSSHASMFLANLQHVCSKCHLLLAKYLQELSLVRI